MNKLIHMKEKIFGDNNQKLKLFFKKCKNQKFYLIALVPFVLYVALFKYWPMYGNLLAFKDFSFKAGIMGSEWVGLKWFKMVFSSPDLPNVMRNTLVMSALNLLLGFPAPILLAIFISEMVHKRFKKLVQSISYLPHFISWIVVVGIARSLLALENGAINDILLNLRIIKEPFYFLGKPKLFYWLITVLGIWKNIGWNSIIYIAAITSIDSQLYESAKIDGANRFRQIIHITIPGIMPTVVILFIFSLGYLLNVGFEQQLFLQNPINMKYSEVIDTYVFKMGLRKYMFSYAQVVSLTKGAIGITLVVVANKISRKFFSMGIF